MVLTITNARGAISVFGHRFGFVEALVQRSPPADCSESQTIAALGPLGNFIVPCSVEAAWATVILGLLVLALFAAVIKSRWSRRVAAASFRTDV